MLSEVSLFNARYMNYIVSLANLVIPTTDLIHRVVRIPHLSQQVVHHDTHPVGEVMCYFCKEKPLIVERFA